MEKENTKVIVSPDDLESWLTTNPDRIYRRSLRASETIVNSPDIKENLLLEFEWEDSVYAKIYIKRSDIKPALDKSINYFVTQELYEEAQKAKNILDKFLDNIKK